MTLYILYNDYIYYFKGIDVNMARRYIQGRAKAKARLSEANALLRTCIG